MKNNTYLSIRRLVVILIVLQLGFLLLIGKLFKLQIPMGGTSEASRHDWRTSDKNDVKRGKILDRHGTVLGISQDLISVSADPKTFNRKSNAHTVASALAPLLDSTTSELLSTLKRKRNGEYVEFVWLKKGIEYDRYDDILNITNKHRGLKIEIEPERLYPKKQLASQVIGYLNDLNHGEGIEYQYHTFLQKVHSPLPQGKVGLQSVSLQDTSSTATLGNSGCNVVLTIDEIIQDIAEKELEQACKKWNASKGTAIVLAVDTSEILAMASCPSYDINNQANANEESKRNLGIWYLFEPGSIFKVVASSAVLNEGIMTPGTTVFCENGRYRLPNRRVIKDISAKGDLSLTEVIQKSSNIGMIKVVERLGPRLFQEYVDRFGFGAKTGVDLPYEQIGSLYTLRKWDTNSLGSVPFGQGISVTPLQMVNALAAIANGGTLHRPYITKEIRDDRGNLIKKNQPIQVRRVLHSETSRKMTEILVGVVEKGSGMRARIEGISIAGKTGTAQKAEKGKGYAAGKEVMSFMGFLPADNPKIAIIVTIDEPSGARFSGLVAAPVFKRIAQQTLEYSDRIGLFDSVPRNRNNISRQYVEKNRRNTSTTGTYTSQPTKNPSSENPQNTSIPDNTLVKNGVGL
ncbi:MAG: penicillin-binding protein 2 [Candidatus Poribacteria bacterium]|nr:penicillin-binding protein 2 [Candidatus Poribacteria bacterium]